MTKEEIDRPRLRTGPKGPILPPEAALTARLQINFKPSDLARLNNMAQETGTPLATLARVVILEKLLKPD